MKKRREMGANKPIWFFFCLLNGKTEPIYNFPNHNEAIQTNYNSNINLFYFLND